MPRARRAPFATGVISTAVSGAYDSRPPWVLAGKRVSIQFDGGQLGIGKGRDAWSNAAH